MTDRIEHELGSRPHLTRYGAVTGDGWLADQVRLDLRPGGDARFASDGRVRSGWVEDVSAPARLIFWWRSTTSPRAASS